MVSEASFKVFHPQAETVRTILKSQQQKTYPNQTVTILISSQSKQGTLNKCKKDGSH